MRYLFPLALLAASIGDAHAVAYNPIPPMSGMFETYNASIVDHLYTINYSQSYQSLWQGYAQQQTPFYIERTAQATTLPLLRFWKGPPQTEHVYVTTQAEIDYVLAYGWVYEGVEGHLYTVQVPGSIPLLRLSKFNGNTGDLAHKYTTDNSVVQQYVAQGWYAEGTVGYVPQTTINSNFVNGYPYVNNGHIMTRRCGDNTACASEAGFRNYYTGYRLVQSTPKPAGSNTQVMTFDLWTPDFFHPNQHEHIAIGLHGKHPVNFAYIDDPSPAAHHHGLGIIFGESNCGVNTVDMEAFWPTGSTTASQCAANFGNQLANNTTYHVRITASDSGWVNYTVHQDGVGSPIVQGRVNGAKLMNYALPTNETGYFIVPATLAQTDYTVYFSNFNVSWITSTDR